MPAQATTDRRADFKPLSLPLWNETYAAPPLPMTAAEMAKRGWDAVDVVFVTGDAYVDHPSFAMAILGRVLEAGGFRVAMLSQPDWHSCEPWRQFGRPRLFFAVSGCNLDSLINHYTANRKLRNDEDLITGFAATRLRMELDRVPLWRGDHVAVKQLVEDFARYPYLPRLKNAEVLAKMLPLQCDHLVRCRLLCKSTEMPPRTN